MSGLLQMFAPESSGTKLKGTGGFSAGEFPEESAGFFQKLVTHIKQQNPELAEQIATVLKSGIENSESESSIANSIWKLISDSAFQDAEKEESVSEPSFPQKNSPESVTRGDQNTSASGNMHVSERAQNIEQKATNSGKYVPLPIESLVESLVQGKEKLQQALSHAAQSLAFRQEGEYKLSDVLKLAAAKELPVARLSIDSEEGNLKVVLPQSDPKTAKTAQEGMASALKESVTAKIVQTAVAQHSNPDSPEEGVQKTASNQNTKTPETATKEQSIVQLKGTESANNRAQGENTKASSEKPLNAVLNEKSGPELVKPEQKTNTVELEKSTRNAHPSTDLKRTETYQVNENRSQIPDEQNTSRKSTPTLSAEQETAQSKSRQPEGKQTDATLLKPSAEAHKNEPAAKVTESPIRASEKPDETVKAEPEPKAQVNASPKEKNEPVTFHKSTSEKPDESSFKASVKEPESPKEVLKQTKEFVGPDVRPETKSEKPVLQVRTQKPESDPNNLAIRKNSDSKQEGKPTEPVIRQEASKPETNVKSESAVKPEPVAKNETILKAESVAPREQDRKQPSVTETGKNTSHDTGDAVKNAEKRAETPLGNNPAQKPQQKVDLGTLLQKPSSSDQQPQQKETVGSKANTAQSPKTETSAPASQSSLEGPVKSEAKVAENPALNKENHTSRHKMNAERPLEDPGLKREMAAKSLTPEKGATEGKHSEKPVFADEKQVTREAPLRSETRQVDPTLRNPDRAVKLADLMQNSSNGFSGSGQKQEGGDSSDPQKEAFKAFDQKFASAVSSSDSGIEESGVQRTESSRFQNDFTQRMAGARETLRHFSMEIKEEIRNYKPPVSKISMELKPEKLGSVEVTITSRGNQLQVSVASNQSALQMLMQHAQEFKASLNQAGLGDAELNFNMQDREQPRDSEQNQRNENSFQNFSEELDTELVESLELTLPKYI